MSVRVTCISKSNGDHENPHAAISSVGWTNESTNKSGSSTRLVMYDWIKDENGVAYVRDRDGNQVRVGTAETARGTKYIRTYRDKVWTDNLLAMPEC
jgi:hypothetical protein